METNKFEFEHFVISVESIWKWLEIDFYPASFSGLLRKLSHSNNNDQDDGMRRHLGQLNAIQSMHFQMIMKLPY